MQYLLEFESTREETVLWLDLRENYYLVCRVVRASKKVCFILTIKNKK